MHLCLIRTCQFKAPNPHMAIVAQAGLQSCRLPVQAISLDFLGVPGSAVASKTLDLVEKHGFPSEKRLGAGVVDGRSVWSDGAVPAALVASLHKKVHACALMMVALHCNIVS